MLDTDAEVLLGGMIASVKKSATKKPNRNGHTRYANFDLEDAAGVIRCIMWPEDYARLGDRLEPETICFVKGKVDRTRREPNLIVNQLLSIEEAEKEFTSVVAIKFQRGLHTEDDMRQVHDILRLFPGQTEVRVVVDSTNQEDPNTRLRYTMSTPSDLRVSCSAKLRAELGHVLGEEHFRFHAASKKSGGRSGNANGYSRPAML